MNPPHLKTRDLCIALLIIIISSCVYEPLDTYNNPINENVSPPEIENISLDLVDDTFYVLDDEKIRYDFQSSNQQILKIDIYLDGFPFKSSVSARGSFELELNDLNEGAHELDIFYVTKSGTGSIADELRIETLKARRKWVFIVRKEKSAKIFFNISNGFQEVSWDKYYGSDFLNYEIIRVNFHQKPNRYYTRTKTSMIDSCYVGEQARYFVYVIKKNGDRLLWSRKDVEIRDLPSPKLSATESNEYFISWPSTRYYNALGKYKLTEEYYTLKEVFSGGNLSDTVYRVTDGVFLQEKIYKLSIEPKYAPFTSETNVGFFQKELRTKLGYQLFNDFFWTRTSPLQNNLIVFSHSRHWPALYSFKTNTIKYYLKPPASECTKDPQGYIYPSHSGNTLLQNTNCQDFYVYHKEDNYAKAHLHTLKNTALEDVSTTSISDIGTLAIRTEKNGIYIYNYLSETYTAHHPDPEAYVYSFSSNGRYLILGHGNISLYEVSGDSLKKVTDVVRDRSHPYLGFHKTNETQYILRDNDNLVFYNIDNFSPLRSLPLNGEQLVSIDCEKGQYLTRTFKTSFVRDLNNGNLLVELPFYDSGEILYSNKIISRDGMVYFINDLQP